MNPKYKVGDQVVVNMTGENNAGLTKGSVLTLTRVFPGTEEHPEPSYRVSGGWRIKEKYIELLSDVEPTEPAETLRDRFAMAAIGPMVAMARPGEIDTCAEAAYEVADAMMKARKQTP